MMQLRYVAIAVVLLAGCRKEPRPPPAGGSAQVADAAAPADTAPLPADAAEPPPLPDAPGAPLPDARGPRDAGAPGPGPLPGQGEPCNAAGKCKAGLTCVEYYGIAGPRGGKFTSCEIRCGAKGQCPAGQSCITIADGPGQVCRP
jgi:hypothetical protein